MSETSVLEVIGINKVFPGVQALSDVSITFYGGEVHCLAGENGAGKSTLMNVLSGVYSPDGGEIYLNGVEKRIDNELLAQHLGIAMVHQENSLISSLTVQENLFLGRYMSKYGFINKAEMKKHALDLLNELEIDFISPTEVVSNLSVAEKHLVEIAKALSLNPSIIIFDEPTAALSPKEVATLFNIISQLKKAGAIIIYISHRLDELYKIGDKISVLRDGHLIHTAPISEVSKEKLISLMVGHEIKQGRYRKIQGEFARDTILEVKGLTKANEYENISFELKRGEILGFAGLVGAGRTEVMESIYGYRSPDSGEVIIEGVKKKKGLPHDSVKVGLNLIPEERKVKGLFMQLDVKDNINISVLKKMKKGLLLSKKKEKANANKHVKDLSIHTPSLTQKVEFLSGGNQQKAIIGRWLSAETKILILDEPTHGIDVGAKAEIYELINKLANDGVGIILISSEMVEILSLCDRIAVMRKGQLVGILDYEEATQESIMKYAVL